MKRALIILGTLIVLWGGAIWGWIWLNTHIKSNLVISLKQKLEADAQFDRLSLNLFSGRIEALHGTLINCNDRSGWSKATVEKTSARFSFIQLFGNSTPVEVEIDGILVVLKSPQLNPNSSASSSSSQFTPSAQSWPHISIHQITANHVTLSHEQPNILYVQDMHVEALQGGTNSSWSGKMEVPSIHLNGMPFGRTLTTFSTNPQGLAIENYSIQAGAGTISGNATLTNSPTEKSTIHFNLKQVPMSLLIPAKWQVSLTGLASGKGDYTGHLWDWSQGEATGVVQLGQATLKAIPFLEQLQVISGLSEIASLPMDRVSTEFSCKQGVFTFTDVTLEKQETLLVRGRAMVDAEKLNGQFQLGLPAGIVAKVPNLKEKIFTTEAEGYDWTDVKLSGTPNQFEEDLTPRLLAFGKEEGGKLLNQGKDVLNDGIKRANGLLKKWLAP